MLDILVSSDPPTREPSAGHSVRFYDRDDELMEEVAEFLDSALRSGGLAIAIASAEHGVELRRRISGFGGPVDGRAGWFSGQLRVLDAEQVLESFMHDGQPDAARFERAVTPVLSGGPAGKPVHAFGEMVAVLCAQGRYEAAVALEGLWNDLARRRQFALFCAYPWRLFSSARRSDVFRHVCAAHARVVDDRVGKIEAADQPARVDRLVAELRQQERALRAELEDRKEAEKTLRQRERELAEFLENACEGVHKVGADGTILWANRAEMELLGYAWEDYVGRNIADFYVHEDQIADILARLNQGESLHDVAAVLRCRDGSERHVLVSTNAHFENGQLAYTRCFTRDATEQVRARLALEKAAEERERLLDTLHEASRAKDEFLAMLGHELRNPLSPIVTALQLMRMRGGGGTSAEQAVIQRQVEHLVRLVDDLLDVSRITRGKIELKRQRVEIEGVLARAVEQARLLLEQRRHRLGIDIEPGIQWEGDPVRLAQVVANLLTNAARYTEPGGDIRLRVWREAADRLAISVRDNGRGITPDMLPRLFELFYQGPRGVDRAEGGLGIGLALVRSLVELHGGDVQARSAGRGAGSQFIVRLPLPADLPCGPPACDAPASGARRGPRRRVMIVDDNADAADSLGRLLRSRGHDVRVLHDPVAALHDIEGFAAEVAVLDIGLPGMDGYELGRRIAQARAGDCRLVALTGYGQATDKDRSASAGFHHHFVKPVAHTELLRLIEHAEALAD